MNPRLDAQIHFLLEADRLKGVARRTYISDGTRHENSAEHSWHFALGVLLLREYGGDFDLFRALQMAIIHDLVEIDAGDTFVYDEAGMESKTARENAAATRLFGLLPNDQSAEFHQLWQEFETRGIARSPFRARHRPVVPGFAQLRDRRSHLARKRRQRGPHQEH